METTRSRLGSFLEWIIAAAVIVAIVGGGSVLVREVQRVRAVTPVIAEEAMASEPPAGVPPRTVSVPMLVLADGKELRIGTPVSELVDLIGAAAQVGEDLVERAAGRERITRFYNYLGSRFVVVLEPSGAAEARVAAIYLE